MEKIKNKLLNSIFLYEFLIIFLPLIIEKYGFPDNSFSTNRYFVEVAIFSLFFLVSNILFRKKIDSKILKKFNRLKIHYVFLIMMLSFGFIISVEIPLYEIPDELTHMNMIYSDRNLNTNFLEVINGYTGSIQVQADNYTKVDKESYFDFSKTVHINKIFSVPNYKIIRHFPQWIGMIIGEILGLPVFFYLLIIELFALMFYTFICFVSLKKMPIKKELFMAVMMLPVCLQQGSSVSYDVVLLSFCFLYIASIFELKFTKSKISIKDILLILLYLFIIATTKLPYTVLSLLLLILPWKKIDIKFGRFELKGERVFELFKKNKKYIIPAFIILMSICFIFSVSFLKTFNEGRILLCSFTNFGDTFSLLSKTVNRFLFYYFDSIFGNLGLFNIKTSYLFEVILLIIFLIIGLKCQINKKSQLFKLSKFDISIIYLTIIILCYLIILSMFGWTLMVSGVDVTKLLSFSEIKNHLHFLPYIGGVQGRYFIPIIPLIFIPIQSKIINKFISRINPVFLQIFYYLLIFIYLTLFLLYRFWI